MLDDRMFARRLSPLNRTTLSLEAGLSIRPLAPAARFSLRLRPAADVPLEVADFRLDQLINRVVAKGERWSARLGPDEWLIGGPEGDADLIRQEIETALGERPHSLVGVSHRNVAIEISGRRAHIALNAGCPLDLDDTAFPGGTATRTLLGKAEVILMRPGSEPLYRLECWRSFSAYVHEFLSEAARGLGSATG